MGIAGDTGFADGPQKKAMQILENGMQKCYGTAVERPEMGVPYFIPEHERSVKCDWIPLSWAY